MHRTMRFLIPFLALCLCADGATYYVANAGNDSNNGTTTGTPWKTLVHAQTTVAANDTVNFNRGDLWYENWTNLVNGLTLDAYGSGALPIFDGGFTNRWMIWWVTTSGGMVRNLYLRNAGTNGGSDTGAVVESDGAGTNAIVGCVLNYHTVDDGVARNNGWLMVTNCVVMNMADQGFTMHGTDGGGMIVSGCTISNCLEAFVNSCTGLQLKVLDTVMGDNGTGDIEGLDGCTGTFERCWFKGKATSAAYAFIKGSIQPVTMDYCLFDASRITAQASPQITIDSATIMNNCVLYGNGDGALTVDAGGTLAMTNSIISSWWRAAFITAPGTFTLDHCITNTITTGTQTTVANMVSTADPKFVAPTSSDFHLQSTSPAIRTGLNIGLSLDLDDHVVANPPSVGVYEYGASQVIISGNIIFLNGIKIIAQ
jgi:hypothetical protein